MSFHLKQLGAGAGSARLSALVLFALVAIAIVAGWAFGFGRAEPASASGASMGMRVYSDPDLTDLACNLGPAHRECNLVNGTKFSLAIVAVSPPPGGYTAYQAVIEYTDEVNLQEQSGFDEHLLGECVQGSEIAGPGRYELGCKLTQPSNFSGEIVGLQFECKGGTAQIDLIGGVGSGVSVYVDPAIGGSLVFLKSEDKDGTQVADSFLINCLDPTPTPTPTATRTATSTATNTSTPTSTPTATPTEPPGPKAKMGLKVYADKSKTDLACDLGAVGRKCDVFAGVSFSIDILAQSPPQGGYQAYQAVLQYSGDLTLEQQPGLAESRAPNCITGSEQEGTADGKPGQTYTISCKVSTVKTTYSGVLANIHFVCGADGSGQIDIVGGTGAGVSVYQNPAIGGGLIFLKSYTKGNKQVADSVHVNCHSDFDLDGCSNIQELGTKAESGGLRDPMDYWDFFDTWTPDAQNPGQYKRDGAITVADIAEVAKRFLLVGTETSVAAALEPPTSSTAYHASYDVGGYIGPYSWNVGPASGDISIADVAAVAKQFLHAC